MHQTLAVPGIHPVDLHGRTIVITGGNAGIGREAAVSLARMGAHVVITARDPIRGGQAREHVRSRSGSESVELGSLDLASFASIRAFADDFLAAHDRLDVLVNNAGILRDAFIPGMAESQWDAVIDVHLKGHFAMLHHAAAYWKAQSKAGDQPNAAVINTASGSGVTLPNAGQANYGAAKAGIAALTLIAAEELERYGVRVNAIAPIARTRLTLATPGMGALMGDPEEGEVDLFSPANIAPLVAYLAADKCPVTGTVFAVQGGAISRLAGWHDVATIETDGVWEIDDIAARLP